MLSAPAAHAQTATGTYTGNGAGARSITGLGFQPDIVIIKADKAATEGIIRTSTMATGSRPIWNTSTLIGNNITSLDADGFTVGSDVRVNGLNVCGAGTDPCTYYWTAFKADANIVVGTYTGNGAASRSITGVGFFVDYLMIYGDGNKWPRNRTRFASTTLLGSGANFRIRNAGENSTSIPSLDADGFTVGNGNGDQEDSNSSGVTYHYIAFNEAGGQIKVGSYSGDGTNPRDVTGVGFQPAYVLVQSLDDGDQAFQKSDQMGAALSSDFLENQITGRIIGSIADGFQVSADARVNSSGEDYTYVAFAAGGGASNLTQAHYRWRNDDGPEGSGTPPSQVTSTTDDTTTSATDVVLSGMSVTPGAGDYIAWFSGSVENSTGTDDQFVSFYIAGLQVAHTERQATTDSSIPDTPIPIATHAYIPGLGGQTIDVRWRTTGGTATMHERTLVVAPVTPADVTQVNATTDTATTSLTDVVLTGMTITPGAGDYLVWFSGSVEGNTGTTNQFVSIYQNGAKVAHTERQNFTESSIPGSSFPVATHAFLAGVGAGQPIDIRWRTDGGTATMHERTLVVARVNAADIFQVSAFADTGTSSGTDVVVPPLTLTPGAAADYLAWFSGSMEGSSASTSQFASLYDNGASVAHSQRRTFMESSIPATSFPVASHAYIPGVGAADAVDVRWRTTGGTATMHERTLVLQKLSSVAGATWAEAEDTKLLDLTKGTPKRIRFGISNSGVGGSGAVTYELQVAETATCSAGAYSTVPTGSTGHWQIIGSSFITDGEATNNLPGLSDGATTFVAGELKDAGNTTGSITLASDELTEIEFAVQATTNATDNADYCFRLYDATNNQVLSTYSNYAQVKLAIAGGTLGLADHDTAQVPDRFTSASSTSDVLFRFKLTETPPVTITELRVQYTTGSGVVDADVTAGALYRDNNNDGVVDGGDSLLASGVAGSAGQLVFTGLSENAGAGRNYLVVATVNNLLPGDTTTFSLSAADIDELEVGVSYAGAISNAVHTANAAATVYYSVGTSVADLKNGSPTVTIASGTATFTTSQPANVGVGDEITYNGGTKAYISGRRSGTVYTVTTATGLVPPNVAGATVSSITRAFNSLKVAATDSMNASHLNTSDLVAGDIQLNLACYNDGPDPSSYVRIEEPWITGPTNYIRVFTPVSSSEVGISQRHTGVAGTGYRIVPSGPAGFDFFNFILVSTQNGSVRVEGVEIDGSGLTNGENVRGLMANQPGGNSQDVRFTDNLIHDITNTTIDDTDNSRVFGIFLDDTDNSKVANNIIYNLLSVSAAAQGQARGIEGDDPGKTHHVYNNTIYNVRATATAGSASGILDTGGNTIFARNNYVGLVESVLGSEACFSGSFAAENNNVSSDATAVGAGSRNGQSTYASYFVDVTGGSEDFHLLADSNTLWTTVGADLDSDPVLPVTDDIDGEPRHPSTPDIGADEARVTTNYRSIGTAADYTAGTISATAGSDIVTGTGTAWQTANRGRGDRIDINGVNYTILRVDSETQLRLTQPAAASFSGAYTISRQFTGLTALQDWEDCITGAGGCTYFPVASSNLVADDRNEVGIVYADSTFTEPLDIDNATTDATHRIKLTADGNNRHYGIPGAGVVIDCTGCTADGVLVTTDYVTVEWIEVFGVTGSSMAGIRVGVSIEVLLQFILTHNNLNGIRQTSNPGKSLTVRNTISYKNTEIGIEGDEPGDILVVENCTVFENGVRGVWGALSTATTTVRNTISMNNGGSDISNFAILENSISEDGTASCPTCLPNRDFTDLASPGAPPQGNGWVMFQSLTAGSEDFHLRDNAVLNDAQDNAEDLSASFVGDIDAGLRVVPWDVGADDLSATTEVELVAFEAHGYNEAVELSWETGSELSNLGFHVYRATTHDGPFERITATVIPGLGSSPEGARYRYLDEGLTNGTTYYYELEDIETTGRTERHGPVSATPGQEDPSPPPEGTPRITYGDPTMNDLRLVGRGPNHLVLELVTNGFYAEPRDDGTVLVTIPEFELLDGENVPAIPVTRPWLDAVAGRTVEIVSIRSDSVERIEGLRLAGVEAPELAASRDGTVRARRRTRRVASPESLYPSYSARLLGTGFQGDVKRAQVELAPLQWDGVRGELVLSRRLVVHISFRGIEEGEVSLGGSRGRRRRGGDRSAERNVIARLATGERGLYELRFEDLPGRLRGSRTSLRLSRQGTPVAFHIAPSADRFGPGSKLYFWSEGADANPYGTEAVYELEAGLEGRRMSVGTASPAGAPVSHYWKRQAYEENRLYQAGLTDAPDLWLWDALIAPVRKSYAFEVRGLVPDVQPSRLSVWLQGTSDSDANPDHHVRIHVNGTLVSEATWDGKRPHRLDADMLWGVMREGENWLSLESLGDTEAPYSLTMLNRFEVEYPSASSAELALLEGRWTESGAAIVTGMEARSFVLDVTDVEPRWLEGFVLDSNGGLRFRTESSRRYFLAGGSALLRPEVRNARSLSLRQDDLGADYVVIGPESFLAVAEPLLEHRRDQGLRARGVAVEDIYEAFGYGESRPEAIRDFIEHAYHHWAAPSMRYVVLLGDASYDFKDYLGTGAPNPVPPLMVKTSYLWTVSDPALGAVNGDDRLPDVAVGRLPAADLDELRIMVEKILAYESGGADLSRALVLVADHPDGAGDFDADVTTIVNGVLSGRQVDEIRLSELGRATTRGKILDAFDNGASLVSYAGHGGIHLWSKQNIFNIDDVDLLQAQSQQPLFLAMNCLNGYFHFPYFDSLAEALVESEHKGAIAAFAPAGLSRNTSAHRFHELLLDQIFNGGHPRLGDAVLAAQTAYANTGLFEELLSIYHLLGDPALELR